MRPSTPDHQSHSYRLCILRPRHLSAADVTSANVCPNGIVVNIIAYEFPFCLAGEGLVEKLFLSRPTDTKLTSDKNDQCVDVNATRGVPHSFFYTVDGSGGDSCKLLTYDQAACKGVVTQRSLSTGFSDCITKGDKLVKPIIKSAKIQCTKA